MVRNRGELSDAALARALGQNSVEAVFDGFLERFFVRPADARERAQAIATSYPQHARRTREAAERALRHVVDLLGSGPVQLDERIDWQRDFVTGFTWSNQ